MIKDYDQLVKLILIGGSGVGKSSVLMQFAENKFNDNYLTTIGVDFRFKTIKHQGRSIKFQIWDTAGQQRFRTITSAYYKGADGILMVYDLTQPSSLEDLEQFWIPEAYNYCDKNIKVLLMGNKSDCDRTVNPEKVKKVSEKYNFKTEEVSAKTGQKVFDSIRDFGLLVARQKLQKSGGIIQNPTSSTVNQSTVSSTNQNKEVSNVAVSKQQPKAQTPKEPQQQSIQISSKNAKKVPNYSKKCC